jgi:hypothetical protein
LPQRRAPAPIHVRISCLAVDGHDTIRDFGNNVDTTFNSTHLVEDFMTLRLLANVVNGNLVITFYPDTSLTLNNIENINALLDDVTYLDSQVEAEQRSFICCRFRGRLAFQIHRSHSYCIGLRYPMVSDGVSDCRTARCSRRHRHGLAAERTNPHRWRENRSMTTAYIKPTLPPSPDVRVKVAPSGLGSGIKLHSMIGAMIDQLALILWELSPSWACPQRRSFASVCRRFGKLNLPRGPFDTMQTTFKPFRENAMPPLRDIAARLPVGQRTRRKTIRASLDRGSVFID